MTRPDSALLLAAFALSLAFPASGKTRAECEATYTPKLGQAGKDVVWIPTPDKAVATMLEIAKVGAKDIHFDLGAGDAKFSIAAARLGASSVGIEYNPDMAKLAQCYVESERLEGQVKIVHGDIFQEDFSRATVVTMYLLPTLNIRLRPILLQMRPGTRVVSHNFSMGDWDADQVVEVDHSTAYLWIVPAKVGGSWNFRQQGGSQKFAVDLKQRYQRINGEVSGGMPKQPLVAPTVTGSRIQFVFADEKGLMRTLTGTVKGDEIDAVVTSASGRMAFVGTRQ